MSPNAVALEALRILRVSICAENPLPVVFVASVQADDGRERIGAGLAVSFARGGFRTALIDGTISAASGLAGYDRIPESLQVIRPPSWVSNDLSRAKKFISELRELFDAVVIVASKSPLSEADVQFATLADGAVVVMREGRKVGAGDISLSRLLRGVQTQVFGVVPFKPGTLPAREKNDALKSRPAVVHGTVSRA